MEQHYSQPKGFVGRNICYAILYDDRCYGFIAGGSATKWLPNRNEFFNYVELNQIVNNLFFHVYRHKGRYPFRNFVSGCLAEWRKVMIDKWFKKYGDMVVGFESLVQLPRTGECYKRDGWKEIGITKGYTCKREAGYGTDSWSGQRVWNTTDLKPKRVFVKKVD